MSFSEYYSSVNQSGGAGVGAFSSKDLNKKKNTESTPRLDRNFGGLYKIPQAWVNHDLSRAVFEFWRTCPSVVVRDTKTHANSGRLQIHRTCTRFIGLRLSVPITEHLQNFDVF